MVTLSFGATPIRTEMFGERRACHPWNHRGKAGFRSIRVANWPQDRRGWKCETNILKIELSKLISLLFAMRGFSIHLLHYGIIAAALIGTMRITGRYFHEIHCGAAKATLWDSSHFDM